MNWRPPLRRLLGRGRRAIAGPLTGQAVVLMYHRVADVTPDPWSLCVSPRNFTAHMRLLRDRANCTTVANLMPALAGGARAPLVAVSFDDGYADNARAALPALVAHEVPATFFLVSDMIAARGEFWWDAIGRVFLSPGKLPARLELVGRGIRRTWDLGPAVAYDEQAARLGERWRADGAQPPGPREALYLEVWNTLAGLDPGKRDRLVGDILAWAEIEPTARPDYAVLDAAEFDAMAAAAPLVEIGGHTRTHPSLPDLSVADQEREMAEGRAVLEARIGRPVTSFSYPFGRQTAETREAARRAGFAAACTSAARAVRPDDDPFAIPRVQVKNWDGRAFGAELDAYF